MGHRQRTTGPVVFACELVLLPVVVLLKGDPAADELVVVFERVVVEELCALLCARRVAGGLDFSAR